MTVRRAVPGDNDRLCALMAGVPMRAGLRVAAERHPDYFALYRMQRGDTHVFVYDRGGVVGGMGTVLTRPGWHEQRPATVGYLGDLRAGGFTRDAVTFPLRFGELLDEIAERDGCEAFFTCILAENAAALNALVRRAERASSRRQQQPRYTLYRRYEALCVTFVRRPRFSADPALTVRTACEDDVDDIRAFLARDHASRPFGFDYAGGELEHRLATWPGYTLANTYLCFAKGERLVGVTTAWDAAPVRRYRVESYERGWALARAGFAAIAKVTGCTPLPAPGGVLRSFFLANLSIAGDDPRVLRALVDRIYADGFAAGYHFFMLPLYEDDPLARAFAGRDIWTRFVRRIPFLMYVVTPRGRPAPALPAGRPGFEIALA